MCYMQKGTRSTGSQVLSFLWLTLREPEQAESNRLRCCQHQPRVFGEQKNTFVAKVEQKNSILMVLKFYIRLAWTVYLTRKYFFKNTLFWRMNFFKYGTSKLRRGIFGQRAIPVVLPWQGAAVPSSWVCLWWGANGSCNGRMQYLVWKKKECWISGI